MAFEKIIVLDDELIIRKSLEEQLRKRRYSVASAKTISETQAYLGKDHFDLIFIDMSLPDGNGLEILDILNKLPEPPIAIMITGNASIQSAVESMRRGAFDYIIKPFDFDQIDVVIKKAESFKQLVRVNRYLSQSPQEFSELIGESQSIQELRSIVRKVAATEATVLIEGENGTGKELIALELFKNSSRSKAPYVKVNCAAISETLMESEFFGHERGAFTGALERREGRFELADGGTILLDEISEISPKLQAKLLRVLQEKEFERVGSNKTIKTDVRVIATTNRNLLQSVQRGEFREDLYYRLKVFPIRVPPLRERSDDIILLANSFLERFSKKHGKSIKGFSKNALNAMLSYNWPGNVRELQNTVERAIILADPSGLIDQNMLGLISISPSTPPSKKSTSKILSKNSDPLLVPVS